MSMLGVYLAPGGNNKYQVKYMHLKATTWETSTRAGGVQHNKAWKALNYTTPQIMKYPLPTAQHATYGSRYSQSIGTVNPVSGSTR